MKHSFNFILDKEYFTEAFEQSVKYASKWQKVEWFLGTLFIIAGFLLQVWSDWTLLSPIVLILIGLFELFSSSIKKVLWLRRQMKSKTANSRIEIEICDEGINSSGLYSNSEMLWQGIERILETPKGLFIWPQKGIHIYLPKKLIPDDVMQFILNQVKT